MREGSSPAGQTWQVENGFGALEVDSFCKAVIQRMSEGVLVLDRHGTVLGANAAYIRIHGFADKMDHLVTFEANFNALEMSTPEGFPLPESEYPYNRTLRGEILEGELIRVSRRDGSHSFMAEFSSALLGVGEDIRIVLTIRDVTARVSAERALQDTEQRMSSAIRLARLGVWEYDHIADEAILDARCREILGLHEDRPYTNKEIEATFHPDDLPSVEARLRSAIDLKSSARHGAEYRIVRPDGVVRWIAIRGNAIQSRPGEVRSIERFVGTLMDITARKRAEEALRHSERLAQERAEELSSLIEAVPAYVYIAHDPQATWMTGSRLTYELLGVPLGGNLSKTAPEDQRPTSYRIFKDGVEVPGEDLPMQRAARGEPVVGERMEFRFANGQSAVVFGNASPLLDDSGNPRGAIGAFVDVTAAVRLEHELESKVLERTRELEEANSELERFTYSIAHDLRAPLRSITSASRILLEELGPSLSSDERQLLTRQAASSTKLAKLIDDLLAITRIRRQEFRRTAVDVSALAHETAISLECPKRLFEIQTGMTAFADHRLLSIVLQNLMDNACKYSSEENAVRVGCKEEAGEKIFYVSDEGIGLDMQYADRIFHPFERLHRDSEYPGTGVGLASVQRAIERHSGRVWVESDGLGRGTTFYFTLG